MGSYKILIKRSAEKEFLAVPKGDRRRILTRIRKLSSDPRPSGCERIRGDTAYRIRQGDWRIVYTVSDVERVVTIFKIGHRREVYR